MDRELGLLTHCRFTLAVLWQSSGKLYAHRPPRSPSIQHTAHSGFLFRLLGSLWVTRSISLSTSLSVSLWVTRFLFGLYSQFLSGLFSQLLWVTLSIPLSVPLSVSPLSSFSSFSLGYSQFLFQLFSLNSFSRSSLSFSQLPSHSFSLISPLSSSFSFTLSVS